MKKLAMAIIVTSMFFLTATCVLTWVSGSFAQAQNWVPKAQTVPSNAVQGGQEYGSPLYVCRASYGGGVHPGKIIAGNCHIGWGGKEVVLPNYEVLVGSGSWGPARAGFAGAFAAGQEYGGPLYLCRASYGGGVHPGKVFGGTCHIGWGGEEKAIADYEVFYPTGLNTPLPDLAIEDIRALTNEIFELAKTSKEELSPTDPRAMAFNAKVKEIAIKYKVHPGVVNIALADYASKELVSRVLKEINRRYARNGVVSKSNFVESFSRVFELNSSQKTKLQNDLNALTPNSGINLLTIQIKRPSATKSINVPNVPTNRWQGIPDMAYFSFERAPIVVAIPKQATSCAGGCLGTACGKCSNCSKNTVGEVTCPPGDNDCSNCVWDKYSQCWEIDCCPSCWLIKALVWVGKKVALE